MDSNAGFKNDVEIEERQEPLARDANGKVIVPRSDEIIKQALRKLKEIK